MIKISIHSSPKINCRGVSPFTLLQFQVLKNSDELFEREELSAAPDVGWPDCFNSGVFVYRPSLETYDKLIQFALEKGSFDGKYLRKFCPDLCGRASLKM